MCQMVVRAAAKGDAQVAADAHQCVKTFGDALEPPFLQAHRAALAPCNNGGSTLVGINRERRSLFDMHGRPSVCVRSA